MVDAAPFEAVRYDPSVTGDAASASAPAYDEVEPLTYAAHRTASPYTVLELLTAQEGGGYEPARSSYERWVRTGVLVRDPQPAFYVYEEHELRGGVPAVQRGVLAAVALEPLGGTGAILPHEEVDAARVQERLQRLDAVPLDVSPVFALYRGGSSALRRLLDAPPQRPPLVAVTDEVGTDHRIWPVREPADVAVVRTSLADVRAVIADGHHRYATALAHRAKHRAGRPGRPDPSDPWERTLMYLVDVGVHGPRLAPIHREVDPLPADALTRLSKVCTLSAAPSDPVDLLAAVEREGEAIGLWRPDGDPLLLRVRQAALRAADWPQHRSERWRALPTAILEHVLRPALGGAVLRARTDALRACTEQRGRFGTAVLLLPPVAAATVMDLAEQGEPMPPKTTSFRPKPRTGLLMRGVHG